MEKRQADQLKMLKYLLSHLMIGQMSYFNKFIKVIPGHCKSNIQTEILLKLNTLWFDKVLSIIRDYLQQFSYLQHSEVLQHHVDVLLLSNRAPHDD